MKIVRTKKTWTVVKSTPLTRTEITQLIYSLFRYEFDIPQKIFLIFIN